MTRSVKHYDYLRSLFSVPAVDSFAVSANSKLVFSSNIDECLQLYLLDCARADADGAVRLTSDNETKTSPVFSEDGKSIAYFSDRGGDENFDLFALALNGSDESDDNPVSKKAVNLTPSTDHAILPHVSFSPGWKYAAVVANMEGDFATYVLNFTEGSFRRVTHHNFSDITADFSPDGEKLAVTSSVSGQEFAVFILNLKNGNVSPISDPKTGARIDASSPSWSTDGRMLSFVSSASGYAHIGILAMEDGCINWVTSGQTEHLSPALSPDSKWIAYAVNDGVNIGLEIREMDRQGNSVQVKRPKFPPGIVNSIKFSPDSKHVYFLFSGSRVSSDVFRYSVAEDNFEQITHSISRDIDVSRFIDGRTVNYKSKADDTNLRALLFLPGDGGEEKRLPAVLQIHGGPAWQASNYWNPLRQMLLSRGIAVIAPNYRGSTGSGRKFMEANRFVMGNLDIADCVSAADYLIQEGLADPNRIAVMGASFGGYLTMCALTKYENRWVCGSATVPFLNWFTEMENEREDLRFWDLQNMGNPETDAERLREASPIFFIDRIRVPVQIIAGANDPRCPLEESIQAKEKLESLGMPVDFKFYEDEGHSFSKLSNIVDSNMRTLAFLEKHLVGY